MRRKLFTLCSAVSLVLCVAVCAAWALSFSESAREAISFDFDTRYANRLICWDDGSAYFSSLTRGYSAEEYELWSQERITRYLLSDADGPWFEGPYYTSHPAGAGELFQCIVVPCWMLVVLLAILPTA